ncbi:2-oxoacid:acceptor oxidoreductase family protein [Halanaerobaculum tunisiense]
MEETKLVMAGFGGQGVMLIGKLLAYSGMKEEQEVSWIPSYGPEMRGGTANCNVIVSDELIASPVVSQPDIAVIMNRPSLDKFVPKVKSGGSIFVNTSLIDKEVIREDVSVIEVSANEIANELGSNKVANMVMLAAVVAKIQPVKFSSVVSSLEEVLPEHRYDLLSLNQKALEEGKKLVD